MHQKKLQFDKTLIDDNDQENIILIKAVDWILGSRKLF